MLNRRTVRSRSHATYTPSAARQDQRRRHQGMAVPSPVAPTASLRRAGAHGTRPRSRAEQEGTLLLAAGLNGLVVSLLSLTLLSLVVRLPAVLAGLFPDHRAARIYPVLLAVTLLVLVRGALMRTWYWTVRQRLEAATPARLIRTALLLSHSIAFVLLMAIVAALLAAGVAAAVDLVLIG